MKQFKVHLVRDVTADVVFTEIAMVVVTAPSLEELKANKELLLQYVEEQENSISWERDNDCYEDNWHHQEVKISNIIPNKEVNDIDIKYEDFQNSD